MGDSWKYTMSQRRPALGDSEYTDTECGKDNLLPEISEPKTFCANCSTAYRPADRLKFKKTQTLLTSQGIKKFRNPYTEELELKVMNEEIIERELCDKQIGSREQVENINDLLKTISMYAQSLEVRDKLAKRIHLLLHRVSPEKTDHKRPPNTSSCTSLSKSLKGIVTECGEDLEVPDAYYETLTDCTHKYRDFTRASANFCRILQQPNPVSNGQLRKLENQYESIRSSYNESKATLNRQVDQVIQSKLATVDKCFQCLIPSISQTLECEKEMFNLISELSLSDKILKPERKSSNRSTSNKAYRRGLEVEKCACVQRGT